MITLCECDCMKSGEVKERERIVKLLAEEIAICGKDSWLDAIALIKGEQK